MDVRIEEFLRGRVGGRREGGKDGVMIQIAR